MVVTLGQQYNIGEKPTVILYTYCSVDLCFCTSGDGIDGSRRCFLEYVDSLHTTRIIILTGWRERREKERVNDWCGYKSPTGECKTESPM